MRRRALVAAFCLGVLAGCTGGSAEPSPTPSGPTAPSTSASPAGPPGDWPQYHRDALRTGYDPTLTPVTRHLTRTEVRLDGAVYASPLVVKDTVVVATEGGSLYGIRSGRVAWRRHVGTPVPLRDLPCGNIDPLGITGTPAYDPASGSVFAVAEVTDPIRHVLVAVDPVTGTLKWSMPVDPPGADPKYLQQRGALALARDTVYLPYGGLAGDCGPYIGRVVGVPTNGTGQPQVFTVPTTREGGIWAPPGPVIDGSGAMYVAVGNGAATAPPYDHSDSVLKLDARLRITSFFAPAAWAQENAADADLGSQSPTLVGSNVFIAGKSAIWYTLRQADLGGIGHPLSSLPLCASYGGTAQAADVVYVPCTDGLRAVRIDDLGRMTVLWHAATGITGSPVVGGGAVFALDTGADRLYLLDPRTGRAIVSVPAGPVSRFATPALHGNTVLVGTLTGLVVYAWS
jgi:outer membrane protein assembly factor BamB